MERFLTKQLLKWKQEHRRKPLILRGARQVGKTHILTAFGQASYKSVAYCNFERDKELQKVFETSLDPHKIIKLLVAYFGAPILPQETLIIFDEIQECGPALTSLKYFFEDAPQYAVAAAGSLLGVTLAKQSSFPVGSVDFLSLEPLSFFEFVTASGKSSLIDYLRELDSGAPIPAPLADELIKLLGHYQLVGGMPEAVQTFVTTQTYDPVRKVHDTILKSYVNDFAKHAPRDEVAQILAVWEAIPAMLGRESKKFTFSVIRPGARALDYEQAINWLVRSDVVRQIKRVHSPHRPLRAHEDSKAFKLYLNDVGLLCTLMNIAPALILSPDKLLGEFSGAIAECFVAEELGALGFHNLHYWASQGSAEVDFILEAGDQVVPLEVKAGHNLKSKSLTAYNDKYAPSLAIRTSLRNVDRAGRIVNCPLFSLPLLENYVPELPSAASYWH